MGDRSTEEDSVTTSIVRHFLTAGDPFVFKSVVNDILSNLNQNHSDFLQRCQTLNFLLLFKLKNTSVDCELDIERILETTIDLIFSLNEENECCCKILCDTYESSLCLLKSKDISICCETIKRLENDLYEFLNNVDCSVFFANRSLHILEIFINVSNSESRHERPCFKFPRTIMEVVINLLFSHNIDIMCKVLTVIIPKLIKYEQRNDILVRIWNLIEQFETAQKVDDNIGTVLVIICSLSDYYIGPIWNEINFILEFHETFWKLLQKGLISNNLLHRKQSLYLLKRSVDFFNKSGKPFNKIDLFWWDLTCSKEVLSVWESMFLLFEVFEEKQVHLITPAFSSLNNVIEACESPFTNGKVLHPSWMICIFNRIVCHDSNTIIKLGITTFMSINVCIYCNGFTDSNLLEQILKSLNDMFLFEIVENHSCPFANVLSNWFLRWSKCDHNPSFFNDLLTHMLNVCWSPIPLFHISNALTSVNRKPCFDQNRLYKLKKFISEALRTQCIFIRGAIQCNLLKTLTLLADDRNLDLLVVSDVLTCFRSNESLKRHTETWNICVSWLKCFISEEIANQFLVDCKQMILNLHSDRTLTSLAMARMVVLLYDSNLLSCNKLQNSDLFVSIYECLHESSKRLYSCKITQDRCVEFLVCLIQELEGLHANRMFKADPLQLVLSSYLPDLMQLMKARLELANFSTDLNCLDLYISLLDCISFNCYYLKLISDDLDPLQGAAHRILNNSGNNLVQQFFSLKILCWVLKNTTHPPGSEKNIVAPNRELFGALLEELITRNFNDGGRGRDEISYSLHKSITKFVSGCIYSVWLLLEVYLLNCNPIIDSILNKITVGYLLKSGINAIATGGRECVISVLSVVSILLQKCNYIEEPLLLEVVSVGWDTCFELRKTELFWHSIGRWISMVYQKSVIEKEVYHSLLLQYGDKLVTKGQTVAGLLNLLICQLQSLSSSTDLTAFADIITECVIFGPLQKKDDKFEVETCNYIKLLNKECSVNLLLTRDVTIKLDAEVRIRALDVVLMSTESFGLKFLNIVVNKLISVWNELSKNNKRYFNDSRHHRIKHRILQALLIFEALLVDKSKNDSKVLVNEIFNWTVDSLISESQQPSVRYQLEWLFIRMVIQHIDLRGQFWTVFNMATSERVGCVCSFISIAYHLAKIWNDTIFLEECVENIFPWCMAQNFNVRLYAQTVLQKIWQINGIINERYSVLMRSQSKLGDQGNAVINMKKMESDFYFNVFDPIKHFTLQVIFWDLPRLANIASDEFIPLSLTKKCFTHILNFISFGTEKNELTNYKYASWTNKTSDRLNCDERHVGIQKKFVPWTGMFPDKEEKHKKNGLILVASLIDKPPNLGGLARTCEVFSAAELILDSLQYVEDKQFTSLSLTAEKHINISEVKPHNLDKYLGNMKNLGYTVVGAEQASDATSLSDYKFPAKTILVLGNEREGIPVNLLPLLNKCIEIPQFGVIRSLNVHVTGAIFLWEYAKQHLHSNTI